VGYLDQREQGGGTSVAGRAIWCLQVPLERGPGGEQVTVTTKKKKKKKKKKKRKRGFSKRHRDMKPKLEGFRKDSSKNPDKYNDERLCVFLSATVGLK